MSSRPDPLDPLKRLRSRQRFRRSTRDDLQLPVFVYGSLRRGQTNYWLLRGNTVKELPATLEGVKLYSLRTYPMMVEAPDSIVQGELMVIHPARYAGVLPDLDRLEGYEPTSSAEEYNLLPYWRVKRLVTLEAGGTAWAWTYLGNPSVLSAVQHEPIPHGDWVRFQRERTRRFVEE